MFIIYSLVASSGILEEEENKVLDVNTLRSNQTFLILTILSAAISLVHLVHLGLSHRKMRPYLYQKLLIMETDDDIRGLSSRSSSNIDAALAIQSKKRLKVKYPLFLVSSFLTSRYARRETLSREPKEKT